MVVAVACTLFDGKEQPVGGGTYREALIGQPQSLNPLLTPHDPITRDVSRLVYAGLVRVRDGGVIEGDLAADWKTSDDGLTYLFRLRPGATWHDGRPVTANDVLATIALLQAPGYAGPPELAALWRRVRAAAPAPDAVSLQLYEPYASFIEACSLPILPAHVFGADGSSDLREHPASYAPVGAGPFRVQAVDARGIRLARHDGYPGARPFLEQIELQFFPDLTAAAAALDAGGVDGLAGLPPAAVGGLAEPARFTLREMPLQGHQTVLLLNQERPRLQDVAVRRAIARQVDRAALIEAALGGQAVAAYGPVPAYSWAYDPGVERGLAPGQAARLLDEAGWAGAPVRTRNGLPLRLGLIGPAERQSAALGEALATQLAGLGMQVDWQAVEPIDLYGRRLRPREYDLALVGLWLGTVDPDPYTLWHSSQRQSGLNLAGYAQPVVDQLLSAARLDGDPTQRYAALSAFQRFWLDDVPSVVLSSPVMTYAMASIIRGVRLGVVPEPGARFQHVDEWFVNTQRAPALP